MNQEEHTCLLLELQLDLFVLVSLSYFHDIVKRNFFDNLNFPLT